MDFDRAVKTLKAPGGKLKVLRSKDRVTVPLSSGYRDVLLNLVVEGCDMVIELQFHLKDVIRGEARGSPDFMICYARAHGWEMDEVEAGELTKGEPPVAAPVPSDRSKRRKIPSVRRSLSSGRMPHFMPSTRIHMSTRRVVPSTESSAPPARGATSGLDRLRAAPRDADDDDDADADADAGAGAGAHQRPSGANPHLLRLAW